LFFRLAQQAMAVEPAPYKSLVKHVHRHRNRLGPLQSRG
jgi:hypothetical protein